MLHQQELQLNESVLAAVNCRLRSYDGANHLSLIILHIPTHPPLTCVFAAGVVLPGCTANGTLPADSSAEMDRLYHKDTEVLIDMLLSRYQRSNNHCHRK